MWEDLLQTKNSIITRNALTRMFLKNVYNKVSFVEILINLNIEYS